MSVKDQHEQKFFKALNDIFVGAKIEGDSGFINLMAIKSRYYQTGVFPLLKKDIDDALAKFPEFREELFDKLYTFFQRYFSESGSIYFRYTSLHQNIYEKVYTDDRDVILFWKTHMLYYVKTDRIFRSVNVEVEGAKFFFDASKMSLKKANEKREVIYAFRKLQGEDGTLVFDVDYSERGRVTKVDEILKDTKKAGCALSEDILSQAFRIFEKQSEVDFFINKDARSFLREQFDMWIYQYLFEGQNIWSAERLAQLQVLKKILYKVIDFISQFEDELVKIWNKPKFALNSNYVISLKTLSNLLSEKDYLTIRNEVIETLIQNSQYQKDVIETIRDIYKQPLQKIYVRTVLFDKNSIRIKYVKVFDDEDSRNQFLERNNSQEIVNEELFDRREFIKGFLTTYSSTKLTDEIELDNIYIDTRFFSKEFTTSLIRNVTLQHDLDAILNGFLIKSDCYHVLRTLEKFKNRIKLIYIDPPFNTQGSSYAFEDKFKDSTWLEMMVDRIGMGRDYLDNQGSFYIHLDSNCNYLARLLMDPIFGKEPDREIIWNTGEALSGFKTQALNWIRQHDTILYYSKQKPLFHKLWVKNDLKKLVDKGWLDVYKDENEKLYVYKYNMENNCLSKHFLPDFDTKAIGDVWNDIYSLIYTQNMTRENWGQDNTQKPENLLRRIIESSTNEGDIVFDYFVGSGTTLAAAHKLNRKWIGVEMGEYIDSIVLKRMKTIVFGDIRPKLSEDLHWHGGGFFKYYEMEQYEDVLQKSHYEDSNLFHDPNQDPFSSYVFLRDLKMLDSLEVDQDNNHIHFHPERLYPDIDLAETLSHRTGKWIKRITKEFVEFQDGTQMSLVDPDWQTLKPMIWWQ